MAPSAPPPGLQALPCPPPSRRPLCHRGRGASARLGGGLGPGSPRGVWEEEGSLPTRSLPPPSLGLEAVEWPARGLARVSREPAAPSPAAGRGALTPRRETHTQRGSPPGTSPDRPLTSGAG